MKLPRWATALDVVAVVMALVAISVVIGGGFRIWIFDSRLSVTELVAAGAVERGGDRASGTRSSGSSRFRSASSAV